MSLRFAALGIIFVGLGGCAIHPIPDEVTGYSTFQIVRKVRCEARDALLEKFKYLLSYEAKDAYAQTVLSHIDDPNYRIDLGHFSTDTKSYINFFGSSAIGYNFTFDITEMNNADLTIGLLDTFSRGTATLGFTADDDRMRENTRNFTITDTFGGLLFGLRKDYCHDLDVVSKNYQYPIAGNIGIDEEIGTFVDLSLLSPLGNNAPKGPPTMADTIKFTTKLVGSANPHLQLTALKHGFQLASADFSSVNSRQDIHSVIVALSLPLPTDNKKKSSFVYSDEFVTVSGTAAEQSVGKTISQQILRFETAGKPIVINGSNVSQ